MASMIARSGADILSVQSHGSSSSSLMLSADMDVTAHNMLHGEQDFRYFAPS